MHLRRPSALAILLLIAFFAEMLLLVLLEFPTIVALIPDDSFFYLILGRNFPGAGDFSFDGVHSTYGFQPLWQVLLIPLAWLARSGESLVYLVLAVCSVLHVVSGARLHALLKSMSGTRAAAAGTAFWILNPSIIRWFWGLKENGLYALLLLLVLERSLRYLRGASERRDLAILGGLIGLTVLARVNFAMLGALLLVFLVWAGPGGLGVEPIKVRLK